MRIHVLSDIHLEFAGLTPPAVAADLTILAGDVGLGTGGVEWAREAFPGRPVVYVPGNHEYYRSALPRHTEKLRAAAAGSHVRVLERDLLELPGLTVLGCTLWTDLALGGDPAGAEAALARGMNDYHLIRLSPRYRRLRPGDTAALHRRSLRWLEGELAAREGPLVVVTHHAPSRSSLEPGADGDPLAAGWASDLDGFIRAHQPALWVHGHVHRAADYRIGRTRVLCNPRGYPGQAAHGFSPGLVIEVETHPAARGSGAGGAEASRPVG